LWGCKFVPAAAIRHLCNFKRLRNIGLRLHEVGNIKTIF
jgi:hypothetical protein